MNGLIMLRRANGHNTGIAPGQALQNQEAHQDQNGDEFSVFADSCFENLNGLIAESRKSRTYLGYGKPYIALYCKFPSSQRVEEVDIVHADGRHHGAS